MEHFVDAGCLAHVFIRFNPDAFFEGGEKQPGCWGKLATGEPRVMPKMRRKWEERLERLAEVVKCFVDRPPKRDVELVHLFYSDETAPQEEEEVSDSESATDSDSDDSDEEDSDSDGSSEL